MIYQGMLIDNSEYNNCEQAIIPIFTNNQINLIKNFIDENIGQELPFIIHLFSFDENKYTYISSRTFDSKIEKIGEIGVIFEDYDLYINENGMGSIRPIAENSKVLIETFSEEQCEQFNVPYITIEI